MKPLEPKRHRTWEQLSIDYHIIYSCTCSITSSLTDQSACPVSTANNTVFSNFPRCPLPRKQQHRTAHGNRRSLLKWRRMLRSVSVESPLLKMVAQSGLIPAPRKEGTLYCSAFNSSNTIFVQKSKSVDTLMISSV